MWNSIKEWVYKHPWYTFWILLILIVTFLIIVAVIVLFFVWLFSKDKKDTIQPIEKKDIFNPKNLIKSFEEIKISNDKKIITKFIISFIDKYYNETEKITITNLPYNENKTKISFQNNNVFYMKDIRHINIDCFDVNNNNIKTFNQIKIDDNIYNYTSDDKKMIDYLLVLIYNKFSRTEDDYYIIGNYKFILDIENIIDDKLIFLLILYIIKNYKIILYIIYI